MLSRRSAIPDGQTALDLEERNKPKLTRIIGRVDTALFHVREEVIYVVIMSAL